MPSQSLPIGPGPCRPARLIPLLAYLLRCVVWSWPRLQASSSTAAGFVDVLQVWLLSSFLSLPSTMLLLRACAHLATGMATASGRTAAITARCLGSSSIPCFTHASRPSCALRCLGLSADQPCVLGSNFFTSLTFAGRACVSPTQAMLSRLRKLCSAKWLPRFNLGSCQIVSLAFACLRLQVVLRFGPLHSPASSDRAASKSLARSVSAPAEDLDV